MSPTMHQYHHGNLKDALLETALKLMSDKGVGEFSLSEVARNVGVTPAAAYKHFKDKEALVAALSAHGFDLLREKFETAAPKNKPARNATQATKRFEKIGQAYVSFGLEQPALFSLIFGKGAAIYRKQTAAATSRTPTFAYLAEALEDLHLFGLCSKAPTTENQWFAWSAIHGCTELLLSGVSQMVAPEKAAQVTIANLLRALK